MDKNKKERQKIIRRLIGGKDEAAPTANPYPKGTQGLIPIAGIDQGVLITSGGQYVKVLELLPINFHLKSELERQSIIGYFAAYLKIAPPNLQILVRTQRADIDAYCEHLEHCYQLETNEVCKDMILDEARLVNYLAETEAITHRFYLVFPYRGTASDGEQIAKELQEQAETAALYLNYAGIETMTPEEPNTHLLKMLHAVINKRSGIHPNTLPEQLAPVFDNPQADVAEEDQAGALSLQDLLAPTECDLTHKDYVRIDGVYHAYLYLTGGSYPTAQLGLSWLSPLVDAGDGISLSFFLERKRKEQILPKISKTTMLNRSRMRDVDDTRTDYEALDDAVQSGMYIKQEINRENEDFYYMATLIEVVADDLESLEKRLSYVEHLCASMDMIARRAVYQQEQCWRSMLPLDNLDADIKRKAQRNVLTTGAAAAFPLASYELCDNEGVLLGTNLYNSSMTILDVYNTSKYSSGNFCLLGMTGVGKTFTLLVLAFRLCITGVKVIIIIPEKGHEYRRPAEAVGGRYIRLAPGSQDCINIMEIRRTSLDFDEDDINAARNDSVLLDKINRLHIFFSLLYPKITAAELYHLDTALLNCYADFGITRDNASLLRPDGSFKTMPDLEALVPYLSKIDALQDVSMAVQQIVRMGLGGQTNVDLDSKMVVIDVTSMGQDLLPLGIFLATEYAQDEISRSRVKRSALISDEIWKIAGVEGNEQAANFIIKMIKIIRGLGGVFMTATQNIIDCFALMGGKFGDALLGNSRFKFLMQMEEPEARKIQERLHLTEEETAMLTRFGRGQGLLMAGQQRISVEIKASQTEYDLLTTDRQDLERRLHHESGQQS